MDGRTELIYADGAVRVGRVHSVVYNASAASAVTRGASHIYHMLSEKSQRTQNGTIFVDLD